MKRSILLIFCFLQIRAGQISGQLYEPALSFTGFPVMDSIQVAMDASIVRSPFADLEAMVMNKSAGRVTLGYTAGSRPVQAWYFPGYGNERALVIGGMHGSELSSIEVTQTLIKELQQAPRPFFDVIIIPVLFPDNAVRAKTPGAEQVVNKGRYTSNDHADPNRQMPSLGRAYDPLIPYDHAGRLIEMENQYLIRLIQSFRPSRIANIHAIRDVSKAGIFADPRTDCKGTALGFENDSSLAVSIARIIHEGGGMVSGNKIDTDPNALYHCDPRAAAAGQVQKRNLHGSKLPSNRGYGVSLGGWATTAVCGDNDARDAMMLFTVEFPGYKAASQITTGAELQQHQQNTRLYAAALLKIFLQDSTPVNEAGI